MGLNTVCSSVKFIHFPVKENILCFNRKTVCVALPLTLLLIIVLDFFLTYDICLLSETSQQLSDALP